MNYIEKALRDYPETRNSDKELVLKVWELQMGKDFGDSFKKWFKGKAISSETIRRSRQKFQENNQYLPNKAVSEARYNKFKEVRGIVTGSKPDDVLTLL